MTTLFYPPKFASELAGAKLTFTQTGTTTPQNTYQDEALTTPHANPVIADSSGVFAPIYLDPTLPSYRVRLTTSANVLVYQTDGYPSNQATSTSQRIQSINPSVLWYDTDGTANQRKFAIRANGNKFEIGAWNDSETIFTPFATIAGGVIQTLQLTPDTTVFDGVTSVQVAYPIEGSFTGTLTGMAGATTGTVNYKVVSNVVTLWIIADIVGTSNSAAMTMTGLPLAVQPGSIRSTSCILQDNTQDALAGLAIINAGTITFRIAKTNTVTNFVQHVASGFTSSGTKGLTSTWMIQYVKTL